MNNARHVLQLPQKLRFNAWVRWTFREKEGVLLDIKSGRYFNMNGTAVVICNGISRGESIGSIVSEICKTYNKSAKEIEDEVRCFVEKLVKIKMCRCLGNH
jgi:hypothetical protein